MATTTAHDWQFSLKAYSDSAFTNEVNDDNQVTLGTFSAYVKIMNHKNSVNFKIVKFAAKAKSKALFRSLLKASERITRMLFISKFLWFL